MSFAFSTSFVLPLVTNNRRHFEWAPRLVVKDWLKCGRHLSSGG